MTGFVDTLIKSFKQALNIRLLLYFLVVQIIESFVGFVVFTIFFLFGLLLFLGSIDYIGIQNIPTLLSNPDSLISVLGTFGLLGFVFLFVLFYITAVFSGIRFNLVNMFLKEDKLNIGDAFRKARPRAFVFFKIFVLIGFAILLAFSILFLFPTLSISGFFNGSGTPLSASSIVFLAVLAFASFIAVFLLTPFFAMLAPATFFEKLGARATIKRSFSLIKTDYLGNMVFVILYLALLISLSIIVSLALQVLGFFTLMPAISSFRAGGVNSLGPFIASLSIYGFFYLAFIVPYSVWAIAFETTAFRDLFFLNRAQASPKPVKKKSKKKRKHK